MVEWRRRLDDFDRKGWHSIAEVRKGPEVEYVGLVNREDDAEDRVVVRLEAEMRDCVRTSGGAIVLKDGAGSQIVSIAEFWTLARRGDHWIVVSIEQDAEGAHHLEAPLVPSPWSDEQGRVPSAAAVEPGVLRWTAQLCRVAVGGAELGPCVVAGSLARRRDRATDTLAALGAQPPCRAEA